MIVYECLEGVKMRKCQQFFLSKNRMGGGVPGLFGNCPKIHPFLQSRACGWWGYHKSSGRKNRRRTYTVIDLF